MMLQDGRKEGQEKEAEKSQAGAHDWPRRCCEQMVPGEHCRGCKPLQGNSAYLKPPGEDSRDGAGRGRQHQKPDG